MLLSARYHLINRDAHFLLVILEVIFNSKSPMESRPFYYLKLNYLQKHSATTSWKKLNDISRFHALFIEAARVDFWTKICYDVVTQLLFGSM